MSYTQPHGQPQGVARTPSSLLRESLVAEIVAINGYQQHIADSDMPDINAAWQSIMEDEKKHYGMFLTSCTNTTRPNTPHTCSIVHPFPAPDRPCSSTAPSTTGSSY